MIGNLQFQLLALALLRISEAGLLQQGLPDPKDFEQQLETYIMYYQCSRKWLFLSVLSILYFYLKAAEGQTFFKHFLCKICNQ